MNAIDTTAAASDLRGLDETARFFGVSTPTVRRWIAAGCPVEEEGGHGRAYKLSLRRVSSWRRDEEERDRAAAEEKARRDAELQLELLGPDALVGDASDGRPLTKREEADFLQAEHSRIKLAQLRGDLVPAAALLDRLAPAMALFRERVRALPDDLAPQFAWEEAETSALLEALDDALSDAVDEVIALVRGGDVDKAA